MHVLHSSQAGSTEGCQNQNVSIQNPCLFYVLWHGDKFPGNNFLKIFPLSSESMMNFPHWRREKTENSHQRHNGSRASLSQIFSSVLDIEERVCVCVCVCVRLLFSFIFLAINFCSSNKLGAKLYFTSLCPTKLSVKGISSPPWCGWDNSETADLSEVNTSKWNIRQGSAGSSVPEVVFH